MSADTTASNHAMNTYDQHDSVWLFGYGSLIFKADFPFRARRPAHIRGWSRRFWQGSHDHRGTAQSPGRVVTLIAEAHALCAGMAYLITPAVFGHLDDREKNGYRRLSTDIVFDDGSTAPGLMYIAEEDNGAFLGAATELDIARQIAAAEGPSGRNADYLLGLAASLRALGLDDPHVFAIERHLQGLAPERPQGARETVAELMTRGQQ